ncbi:MAG: T9SS type A sorting domain-containing protein, partial [Ignavibacteria bacterium]
VEFRLYQNYPNPFNTNSKIKYQIAKLSYVKLIIYDILGSEIGVLVDKKLSPGIHEVIWNASNFASGVYFYRIEAGKFIDTKKMVIVK